ncbi:MAG: type II toxin-antitoxin system Phd/YefM family antitoxin [Aeromicrobium sp.]|jgi:prevent-host-death family protein|nr:type II toxin-antitoxin system Phd/YefM family antitoxin [Aeromicrobium sp.]
MTRIMVMSETLPLADVKARLSEIIDRVEGEHERVIVTRRGRPAAVILSPEDLDALEETLDLLSTPGLLDELRRGERDLEEGRYVTAADLRARFLKE